MTTLRVVVDQIVGRAPDGVSRYTEELTRELIATAPAGCDVEGIVASHAPEKYLALEEKLPGLSRLHIVPMRRRELARAWQYGVPVLVGGGMIHSPSLFAPFFKHDRMYQHDQTVATIHDVIAWTNPETLLPRDVAWHKAMAKRARKHADAIVVPTHAVGNQLAEFWDFGDRIRVIGGAASPSLRLGPDADERAAALRLPERYVLSMGALEPRKGIRPLLAAMKLVPREVPLLLVGNAGADGVDVQAAAAEAGLAEGRVRALGQLSDSDLAVVLDRAAVFVYPSLVEGFGLPIVEAFTFGTPVVHSDDPALNEVAGGAGISVPRADFAGYPERLAAAITSVLTDQAVADRLAIVATDRARAFSWRDSAERVWQLHADL